MATMKYEIPSHPNTMDRSRLLFLTISQYEKDWVSAMHYHEFTEIFYVTRGHGYMNIENEMIPIRENTLVTINPFIRHTEISDQKSPLEYMILGAKSIHVNSKDTTTHSVVQFKTENNPVMDCFHSILTELKEKKESYHFVCQNFFEILVIHLCRHENFFYTISEDMTNSNWHFQKIREFIDRNYQDKITLDSLAEIINLNKYYLSHKFSEIFGISPIAYLNLVRIKVCKDLLRNSNHSIEEIASMVGFSSRSYMAQVFLKLCDMTALQYRKTHAKDL